MRIRSDFDWQGAERHLGYGDIPSKMTKGKKVCDTRNKGGSRGGSN